MDDRAQAIGIARLGLALTVGAFIAFIVTTVTSPLFDHVNAETSAGSVGATGTQYLTEGVAYLPIAFLGISFFGLIAYSVYTREVLR